MIRDILSVFGGAMWLIVRFILIIALSVAAVYCVGTLGFFPFIWEGLKRLGIAAACIGLVVLLIRSGRDKDDEGPMPDDFRP